jgi:DNA-binding NtrC family response regulator
VSIPAHNENERTAVLNIGVDKTYLARRTQILSAAGFEVIEAGSAREAVARANGRQVRIAIFGHRLPAADRLTISSDLRKHLPNIRIVVMYDQSVTKTEHADAVLQINVPPADLVLTMQYLLSADAKGRLA